MMRIWITICLVAAVVGCSRREESDASGDAAVSDRGGHTDHHSSAQDDHAGHKGMAAPTQRQLVVRTEPSPPEAGTPTNLLLQIQDEDGTLVKQFDVTHEELVHLIIVREGLDEFAHLHPDVHAVGALSVEHSFPKAGNYRLFADYKPQREQPGLAVGEIAVAGEDGPAAELVPNESHEVVVGEITSHITVASGEEETTVRFHFVDEDGQTVEDLQPYLGAMVHLVIISEDGRHYVHAHPLSEATSAPDGVVAFVAHFPKHGTYKMWGQFRRDDAVFTVPFVVEHTGGELTPHAGDH